MLSGFALIFCTVTMFDKFSILITSTITFSMLMSFGLFAAMCHTCGPSNTCGDIGYWIFKPIWRCIRKPCKRSDKPKTDKVEKFAPPPS